MQSPERIYAGSTPERYERSADCMVVADETALRPELVLRPEGLGLT